MINVHQYWVYILSNNSRSSLYVGVTNDLYRRYMEHRNGIIEGFTKKYRCNSLLYYECYQNVEEAIFREKELKGWSREKKMTLIKSMNPFLWDLATGLGWT
jgi:putative endonuclease